MKTHPRALGAVAAIVAAFCTKSWVTTVPHMRVVVDFDACVSNAVCMGLAPEVFEGRDDGFLYVLQE